VWSVGHNGVKLHSPCQRPRIVARSLPEAKAGIQTKGAPTVFHLVKALFREQREQDSNLRYLITDQSGAVVESLRRLRVRRVTNVRGWGCLVSIHRGLRTGLLALTDGGDVLPVTPEDDEASRQVESSGVAPRRDPAPDRVGI
jgi:hypothetical protein